MSSSYYAVRVGWQTGIYSSWAECEAQVKGFKGALYKKFSDKAEANEFVNNGTGKNATTPSHHPPPAPVQKTSSSSSSTSSRSSSSDRHPSCSCGKAAARQMTRQGNNAGKEFFTCSSRTCKYFKWVEKQPPYSTLNADEIDLVDRLMNRDDTIVIYVDGSCAGNRKVETHVNRAGWGVHVCSPRGKMIVELFGPVVIAPQENYYLGAEVGSNNTGELSGIAEALLWLRDNSANAVAPVIIFFDSEYAAKNTLGHFDISGSKSDGSAYKNVALIRRVQALFSEVCASRRSAATEVEARGEGSGLVLLKHVKAHSGFVGNERADLLAKRGCTGEVCAEGRYAEGDSDSDDTYPKKRRKG